MKRKVKQNEKVSKRSFVSESLWPFNIKYICELILKTETRLHDTK